MKKRKTIFHILLKAAFWLYLILLIKLIIFKYPLEETLLGQEGWHWSLVWQRWEAANLAPFRTIQLYLRHRDWLGMISVENLVYNVVAFLPYGVLVPMLRQKSSFWFTLITGTLLSAAIEGIQLVSLLGVFDVDDIILNSFGVFVGYILYRIGRSED